MINIVNKFTELSQREKLLLFSVTIILTPLLILRLVFIPLQNYQIDSREKIFKLDQEIELVSFLGQELQYYDRRSNKNIQALDKQIDTILRRTDLLAKSEVGAEDQIGVNQKLKLTLSGINLTELSTLVHTIEHHRPVILINTLDVSPSYQSPKLFRVSLSLLSE